MKFVNVKLAGNAIARRVIHCFQGNRKSFHRMQDDAQYGSGVALQKVPGQVGQQNVGSCCRDARSTSAAAAATVAEAFASAVVRRSDVTCEDGARHWTEHGSALTNLLTNRSCTSQ